MRRALILVWSAGLALFAGAVALSWNSHPYWMDSEEYALALTEGRWVVHPPGHLLFVVVARLLYALRLADSYATLQALSLLSTVAGMLLLYRLLREVLEPLPSSVLVFAFGLSWVPLLINHTGTSCTADLATVPFLLWAAVRLPPRPTPAAAVLLGLAMVVCGGVRLTTLLMMGPLLAAVVWVHRRDATVWSAVVLAVLVVGLVQVLVVHLSGGWHLYSFMVWKQDFFRTYNLIDDFAWPRLFNAGRALLWFGLATTVLPLALLRSRSSRPWSTKQRTLVVYGALATLGPFAVCVLYLCEHPGYLAPALAGLSLCVAVVWSRADGHLAGARWPVAAILVSLALFFGMHFHRAPASRGQAVANYLLLQYSADGARHASYKTASEWLRQ